MVETRMYSSGTVLFRQGEAGECMYQVQRGMVGVFDHYGEKDECKLAELMSGEMFGEMSLLDGQPRSATVVVLEENTSITEIREADFTEFITKNPAQGLMLAEQMSRRLRKTTQKYVEACRTIYETVEAEKTGAPKSENLLTRFRDLVEAYLKSLRGE